MRVLLVLKKLLLSVVGCFFLLLVNQSWAQADGPLGHLSDLRKGVTSGRASSWDQTGGNADSVFVKAGATITLADLKGAGSIRHIWMTVNSASPNHLRELVLRMYWDGETDPSVECPLGDFFGTGFEWEDIPGGHTGQKYKSWDSLPITVYGKAMNMYFEMPFGKGARITLTNDGTVDTKNFFYQIDYDSYSDPRMVLRKGRFHAQWRSEITKPVLAADSKGVNLDGKKNYKFMHAVGMGQFVGVILAIQGLSTGWPGEGDDMFYIDGADAIPSINGTGLEDYFGSAWQFREEYSYPYTGLITKGPEDWSGVHVMYRFNIEDPIHFSKSLRAGIEHGAANDRQDKYTSVAFWYQTEPHEKLEPLPPLAQRLLTPYWKVELLPKNLPN
jgi:hypothetical protein